METDTFQQISSVWVFIVSLEVLKKIIVDSTLNYFTL